MPDTTTTPEYGNFAALQARYPGCFGKTRAYELLKLGKIRARKFGVKTLWDFRSVDEFLASLPVYGEAA